MKVSLEIHLPELSDVTGKKRLDLDFDGETVSDLLQHLEARYGRKAHAALYDADGVLDPVIQIVLNGKQWINREQLDTPLTDGDAVVLMALLAGG